MAKLKITTAESGASIITAAKNLLKAGARENKKKKALEEMDDSMFIDADANLMLTENGNENDNQNNNTNQTTL
jgi:DNA recombination protein RmuC